MADTDEGEQLRSMRENSSANAEGEQLRSMRANSSANDERKQLRSMRENSDANLHHQRPISEFSLVRRKTIIMADVDEGEQLHLVK